MLATFAFLDLAGFTALTETHGDEAAASLVERFAELVGVAVADDARLVSLVGDGAFVVAETPARALRVLQRLLQHLDEERDFPMLRAGLHEGEAASRGDQFYGNAVNVAARIAGYAGGGQVLCSDTIVAAARAAGVRVRALGRVGLKNLREPLELYSLEMASGTRADPLDPVCRMRVARDSAIRLEAEGREHWFCSRQCLRVFLQEGGSPDRGGRPPGGA